MEKQKCCENRTCNGCIFEDQLAEIFERSGIFDNMSDEEEAELVAMIHNEFEAPWKNVRLSRN